MSRLLNAGFSRMFKSNIFWIAIVITIVLQIISCATDMFRDDISLDDIFFQFLPNVQVYAAVFTSLFLGKEYSEGAVRNKIICGRTRTEIFMSNFLLSAAAGEIIFLVGALSGLCAVPFVGFFKMTAVEALETLALGMLGMLTLSAVLSALEMLAASPRAGIFTVLHVFILTILSACFYSMLCVPETDIAAVTTEGGFTLAEPVPNPNYVEEPMRSLLNFFIDLTPEGQAVSISSRGAERPLVMLLCCIFVTAAALFLGSFFFKRKNIK